MLKLNHGTMTNKVYEEKDYVVVEVQGDQTEATVSAVTAETAKLLTKGVSLVLIDLSGVTGQNLSARKAAKGFLGLPYTKTALFGAQTHLFTVVRLIINGSGVRNKVQLFKTKEEAVQWLHV